MNRLITFVVFTVAFLAPISCSLFTKQNARTALDLADYGCIIANALTADDRVAEVCRISEELKPAMRELLKQHRTAVARDRFHGCPKQGD